MSVTPGLQTQNVNTLIPDLGLAKNYADVPHVKERIKQEIIPLVNDMRSRKQPLNEAWARYYKVWTLTHEEQGYQGRSNVYVPAGKKGVETVVSQLVSGTFVGDDAFGVSPLDTAFAGAAADVTEALKQRVDKMRWRAYGERFYRQLTIYGNAPTKMYYQKRVSKATKRKLPTRGPNAIPGGIDFNAEHVRYDAPVMRTLDPANLYVYPEDVETPEDVEVWAEDISASLADLFARATKGTYSKEGVQEAIREARNPDKSKATDDRLESQQMNSPHNVSVDGWRPVDVTEIWLDFDPDAANRYEEKNPVPFLVTVTRGGAVLRVMPNPFWHQQAPYDIGRIGTMTGRFWGTGFVESIRELQLLLNDQTNQGMDSATYALNPIFLVDPNAVLGTLRPVEPGVQWLVNDINRAVKTITPDMSVLQATSLLTTQSMAWIQDFVGAPPVLQGGSSPGRAFKTATGIGTASQNARVPLQEIIRNCEDEVWEPMLRKTWWLDQQFASADFLFWTYQGKKMDSPKRVPVAAMAGDYAFKWMASTQTDNKAVKGSQIMELLQLLTNPGIIQLFQSRGIVINPEPLVRRMYTEVFGLRDVDEVLIKETLPQPPARSVPEIGAGNPASPPEPPAGAGYDLPPELAGAPEFQEVREGADLMAALAGQNGGAFL